MNYITLFFSLVIALNNCLADNSGNCEIEGIDWTNNVYSNALVNDTDSMEKRFKFTGTLNISNGTSAYIEIVIEEDELVFRSNENFANIDQDTPTQQSDMFTIAVTISLICADGPSILTFMQPVRDINGNPPVFAEETYELSLPMPLMPKYDLTSLGTAIIVTDLDFSNQNIDFAITDSDKFVVDTTVLANKQYQAAIRVTEITRLSVDTTLTITATDKGVGNFFEPKTTTTTLKILIDKDSSEPEVPVFSLPSYSMTYSVEDGQPILTLTSDPITIESSNADNVKVVSDDTDNFDTSYDPSTKTVTVSAKALLPDTDQHVMVLTLTANMVGVDAKASSVVLITMPEEIVIDIPQFSQPYYTAEYTITDGEHAVVPDQDISVTSNADRIDVVLTGEYKDYFSLTPDDDYLWHLSLTNNLPNETLTGTHEVILTLEATVKDVEDVDKGYGTLVIKLPEPVIPDTPKFKQVHYTASYLVDENGLASVELEDGPIAVETTETASLKVNLVDNYLDNFELKYSEETQIVIKQPLDNETLANEKEILLSMEATVSGASDSGLATILVKLPKFSVISAPKFSQTSYSVVYQLSTDDATDSIDLNGEVINVVDDNDGLAVVTFTDTYSENFDIQLNADKTQYEILVKQNLDSSVLDEEFEILATIQAELEGAEDKGYATVLIKLPLATVLPSPKFTQNSYTAEYKTGDGVDSVEMIGNSIALDKDYGDGIVLSVTGDYGKNFAITLNSDTTQYELKVNENLDPSILNEEYEILITVEAKLDGATDSGYALVLITLPLSTVLPAPKFTQNSYVAEYHIEIDSDTDSVEMIGEPVTLDGDYGDGIQLSVTGDYTENFAITLNPDTNQYEISVSQKLDDTILNEEFEMLITVEAKLDGAADNSYATVLIKLPLTSLLPTPKFTQTSYLADYKQGTDEDSLEMIGEAVALQDEGYGDETGLRVTGDYSENFQISLNPDTSLYEIKVTQKLDDSILDAEYEILITVEAVLEGAADSGYTTVLIKLPLATGLPTPKFSQASYIADYKEGTDGTDTVEVSGEAIVIEGDYASQTSVVSDNYAENFQITFNTDSNSYDVIVTQNLDNNTLNSEKEILLTLKASLEGAKSDGYAALMIRLPSKTDIVTPKFSQAYYKGKYKVVDNETDTIDLGDELIAIVSDYADDTSVTIVGDYKENFEIKFSKETDSWVITVVQDLEGSVLEENEVVLTLQASLANELTTSVCLLQLPKNNSGDPPEFTQTYYSANYLIKDETHSLEMIGEQINLVKYSEVAAVALSEQYADNFGISFNPETKIWELTIVQELTDDILNSEVEIVLILSGTLPETSGTAQATLIILLPEKEVNIPEFTSSYYTANYAVADDGSHSLEMTSESIAISNGNPDEATVTLGGDFADNFQLDYDASGKTWQISIKTELDQSVIDTLSTILLTLEATFKEDSTDKGLATLIISLVDESEVVEEPKFSEILYTADYLPQENGETAIINITSNPIKLLNDDAHKAQVLIIGTYKDNFETKLNEDGGNYEILVLVDLSGDTLEMESKVIVSVEATFDDTTSKGYTNLVLELPKRIIAEPPKFSRTLYEADYQIVDGDTDSLKLTSDPITITNDEDHKAIVELFGDYVDYFAIKLNTETNQYDVTVLTDLDDVTLATQMEIVVVIEGRFDGVTEVAYTNLLVKLPEKDSTETAEFSSPYYNANYEVVDGDGTDLVQIDGSITVNSEEASVAITGNYKDNFKAVYSTDKEEWQIEVSLDLTSDVIDANSVIVLTLEATIQGSSGVGYATLVLKLSGNDFLPTPVFTQTYYTAVYSIAKDGTHSVESEVISVSSADATVALQGDYASNFQLKKDNLEYTLEIKDNLGNDTLTSEKEVVVELVASLAGAAGDSSSTLIVQLPTLPSFDKTYYFANYSVDEDVYSMTCEPVTISDGEAIVAVTGDYADNFFIECDADGKCAFQMLTHLDDDILNTFSQIVLGIEAKKTGIAGKTSAAVIINLPTRTNELQFTNTVYTATYTKADGGKDHLSVDSGDQISILDEDERQITVTITGTNNEYFSLGLQTDHWSLNLESNLPDAILEQGGIVNLAIEASLDDKFGSAVLIIKLPSIFYNTSVINFGSIYYKAEYVVGDGGKNDGIDLEDDIVIEGESLDQVKLTVTGDYKDHFTATNNKGKVSLNLKSDLSNDVLKDKPNIVLTIQATFDNGTPGKTSTAVVITLPNSNDDDDDDGQGDDPTAYIVVIAILAILLVGFIVGSAAFYYLKIMRGSRYKQMMDGTPTSETKFSKNPNLTEIKRPEHATRRPTTGIRYSLSDDQSPNESTTDLDDGMERRKSVAFDNNVQEHQIDPIDQDEELDEKISIKSDSNTSDYDTVEEKTQL